MERTPRLSTPLSNTIPHNNKQSTNSLIRCGINWRELEKYVDRIVQEKMIELKEEVKDQIRREILDTMTPLGDKSPHDDDSIPQSDEFDEEQMVLLDESNVDDVAEVLDNKGRGRSASYLVRWSTGGQSRVKVSSDAVRERFKRLRRRYWNRYQAEKEKALRLKIRQARNLERNPVSPKSLDIDYETLGIDRNDDDANQIIKDFLQIVSEVGPENVLNNGYW